MFESDEEFYIYAQEFDALLSANMSVLGQTAYTTVVKFEALDQIIEYSLYSI